jgi:MoxR-like ATPase
MSEYAETAARIVENVETVIVGKRRVIMMVLATMLAEGHALIEDVPGVAKTMLARALAKTIGCEFTRIQCTPDLLPTDVTGVSIFNQKTTEFEFHAGPIFTQIVVADEINRATPRTQSSLLEAMAERQVSVDGVTRPLATPFMVIATQNPVEHEGTFPLPEAQLDRFLVRMSVGYPDFSSESRMIEQQRGEHPVNSVKAVVDRESVVDMQKAVRQIYVHPKIRDYIVSLVEESRRNIHLMLGASPRASLGMYRLAQASALLQNRAFIVPDDVKSIAANVLCHRIIVKPESRLRRITPNAIVDEILKHVKAPVGGTWRTQ